MKKRTDYILFQLCCVLLLSACRSANIVHERLDSALKKEILEKAKADIQSTPVTVTSFIAERSAGTSHDFYSEGDYWWPDSLNSDGPYVWRDGETNPDNFVLHRHAMIRFSQIVGNLTSAYLLTGNTEYIEPAMKHIRAWFMDEQTIMNPNLQYAQAIKGIATGRGIGIIDTVHLIEVVQSLIRLEENGVLSKDDLEGTKKWVKSYLLWMTTHPYGVKEMNAHNNHGTCWAMQAAVFAKYVGDKDVMRLCSDRFKNIFLVEQMAGDGSFPLELERTKPYGYSLFNLDAMAAICQILSTDVDNLWEYTTSDGKNMRKAFLFMHLYIADKGSWPYRKDVMYWDEWPVAQPSLLFAWNQYANEAYYRTWLSLDHFPSNEEVVRNMPIRNPVIWLY